MATQHQNSDNKKVWGPSYWFVMHSMAANYNSKDRGSLAGFKELIDSYKRNLPCEICRKDFTSLVNDQLPMSSYTENAEQLFLWTYLIHNAVNQRIRKPSITIQNAKAFYFGVVGKECKGCAA